MACERRTWAWRRAVGSLARSRRELALGLFGLSCLALGLAIDANAASSLLVIAGVGLFTLGVLLPLVSEFELGTSGFKLKQAFERRDTDLAPFLSEGQQRRLANLAGLLAGDLRSGGLLVEDALVRAYARWSQVPREEQDFFVVCTVVRLALSRSRLQGSATEPAAGVHDQGLEALLAAVTQLTPHERALVLLRHWEDLSAPQISAILGRPTDAITLELEAAEAAYDALVGAHR